MDVKSLYPTHTCFDDALDFLQAQVRRTPLIVWTTEWKLVHAICHPPGKNPYSHAWIERTVPSGIDCYFWGRANSPDGPIVQAVAEKDEFYKEFYVTSHITRYTLREVYDQNTIHGTFGPWEERYQVLTRQRSISNMEMT